jgi:hypothetical protein
MLVGMLGLAAAAAGAACSTGTAAAAGAGAVGALVWTGRQSQGTAQGSMQAVSNRARQVMAEMNITPTKTEGAVGADQQELHGRLNDMDITIELKPKSAELTQVEVTAKKSEVNYERGTSEQILSRILAMGGSASTTSGQSNLNAGSTGAASGYQGMQSASDTSRTLRTDSASTTGTTSTTTSDSTRMTQTDSTGAVRSDSTSTSTSTTSTTTTASPK